MAKYKITAPEPGYAGSISGVHFDDGAAVIDDEVPTSAAVLNYCRNAGYHVEPAEETSGEAGPAPAAEPTKAPESELFDPAKHGADAVLAYLETADHAEAGRVLQAESEGKARKGILSTGGPLLAGKQKEGETQ